VAITKQELLEEIFSDLPEIVEEDPAGEFHYVRAGDWSFCVEEELEEGKPVEDAKALVAFALYISNLPATD